ncbi:hypothetical protein [Candidatus Chloroploca sp. Khr17]|uniref:hypothetical protein n=1 Tax=Candidatus Chloroploca sp. Khr17 TaxID=2496869 RepID=UPI00101D1C12|nr:hypothetical protein [Candidatus Chloroploca sp. Khr17]
MSFPDASPRHPPGLAALRWVCDGIIRGENTMLDKYKFAFANLNVNRSSAWWDAKTCYAAPHKPLMLFSVMDLMAQKILKDNLVQLNKYLTETFHRYWRNTTSVKKKTNVTLPFYHLRSDNFWHLIATPGNERALRIPIHSIGNMREFVLGASLDQDLFELMSHPQPRHELRMVLLETYFNPKIHEQIICLMKK